MEKIKEAMKGQTIKGKQQQIKDQIYNVEQKVETRTQNNIWNYVLSV